MAYHNKWRSPLFAFVTISSNAPPRVKTYTYKFQSSLKRAKMKDVTEGTQSTAHVTFTTFNFSLLSYFRPENLTLKLRNKEIFMHAKKKGKNLLEMKFYAGTRDEKAAAANFTINFLRISHIVH